MELYEVGGCVRDELLGVKSKDIDYTVVLGDIGISDPYSFMVNSLENMGLKVIRDSKTGIPVGAEYLTARGIAPRDFPMHPGRPLDFVLSRKESGYTDGRRPDTVEVGTLYDDLARRDFTMNAIAKDADGSYIDPFNGVEDINACFIRAVGDPFERLTEDALRALRALRFSVTKGFTISAGVKDAMRSPEVLDLLENKISDERKKDELNKMFKYDAVASVVALSEYPSLTRIIFAGGVNLEATMKQKGFK